jgi:hypothetical protein
MYSNAFVWFSKFQESNKQIGIKNVVSKIMKYDNPSIPNKMLVFDEKNHKISPISWNW